MKKTIFLGFATVALLSSTSCKTDFDTDVNDIQVTSGSADFSRYVALGNSLTSGYRDGALYIDGQMESYPNMIAQQMMHAGGGAFNQPLMADNLGGIPLAGISNKLILSNSTGSLAPEVASGTGATTLANIYSQGPYQNMGVPGAKSFHLLAQGYGNPANLPSAANPYYVRFASSSTSTVLGDAMAQNPTFFSLWIGNNDVLGYATSGGDGSNPITDGATFDAAMGTIVNTLTSNGAKGVIANIPNVTDIPFFTRIPYNPVSPSKFNTAPAGSPSNQDQNIDQLNAQVFGPLKQILSATGDGDRLKLLSKTSDNPLLIKDESLTNRQLQISQALAMQGIPPQTAGLIGIVFGQARHTTSEDLIPLSTLGVLGTKPSSPYAQPPSPFNAYGINFPLEDRHILRGAFAGVNPSAPEPNEIKNVLDATAAFNNIIKDLSDSKGLAFFDANAKMNELAANSGLVFDGVKYTATFVTGGTFSLDGVHLTGRGYAVIANEFIKAINKKYGSNVPQVNANSYSGVTFP